MGKQNKRTQRLRWTAKSSSWNRSLTKVRFDIHTCKATLALEGSQKDIKRICLFDRWELRSHWSRILKLLKWHAKTTGLKGHFRYMCIRIIIAFIYTGK